MTGEARRTPTNVAVLGHPSSTRGLIAYTNTWDFLVGPAGMACSGEVGADGGSTLTVWPRGRPAPTVHAHEPGLTLFIEPACVGCKAFEACPFFSQFAVTEQMPCPSGIPPGERAYGLTPHATLFEDPPGVAGDGWPSGGSYPANGIVGDGSAASDPVYRATCTLPASEHAICTVSLNDVFGRYGLLSPTGVTKPR